MNIEAEIGFGTAENGPSKAWVTHQRERRTPCFREVPEEPAYAWNETMSFDEMLEDYTANGDGKEDLLLRCGPISMKRITESAKASETKSDINLKQIRFG